MRKESELPVPAVLGRGNTKPTVSYRTTEKILREGGRIVFVKRKKEVPKNKIISESGNVGKTDKLKGEIMRKILFRGKRNDKGNWIYGYYVFQKKRNGCFGQTIADRDFDRHYVITPRGESFEVIPETVGQYTGLTDKNGTKIFEGDIVKADNGHIGYVEFGGLAQFGKYCKCHKEFETIFPDNETVTGNIHDNPELLKGDIQ